MRAACDKAIVGAQRIGKASEPVSVLGGAVAPVWGSARGYGNGAYCDLGADNEVNGIMNVNELKAYIEGLLAAESDTVPRDAVVRIREMVDKLPVSTITTGGTMWIPGGTGGNPSWVNPTIYSIKASNSSDGAGGG